MSEKGELRFEYHCNHCGKHITMNTRDIINLIERQSKELNTDEIESFFDTVGKTYNLCPRCARDEGFDVENFEGTLEELEKELETLKQKEFMLQMVDHWSSEDYRYDQELTEQIRKVEEEIKNEKSI